MNSVVQIFWILEASPTIPAIIAILMTGYFEFRRVKDRKKKCIHCNKSQKIE